MRHVNARPIVSELQPSTSIRSLLAQKKRIAEDAKLSPRERAKRKEGGGLLSRLGGSFKGVGSSLKVMPPVVTAVRTADDVPANGSPSAVRPFDEA